MSHYSDFDKTGLSIRDCLNKLKLEQLNLVDELAGDLIYTVHHIDMRTDPKLLTYEFVPAESVMMLLGFTTTNHDGIYAKFLYNERILYSCSLDRLFYIEHGSSLSGKTFCFTGKLRHIRNYYATLVSFQGGKYKKNINKDLNYLVCGEDVGHNKTEAAKRFGVKKISEKELFDLISEGKKKTQ